jgi:hypothetical protein
MGKGIEGHQGDLMSLVVGDSLTMERPSKPMRTKLNNQTDYTQGTNVSPEEAPINKSQRDCTTNSRQDTLAEGLCSVCHRKTCIPFTAEEQSCFDKTVNELQELLGVCLAQAQIERHQCEVSALAQWCSLQGDVISKSGEFLPDRVVPHDTTASIDTTVENPILKARPDKSSPQQKLDIAEMVEAKL